MDPYFLPRRKNSIYNILVDDYNDFRLPVTYLSPLLHIYTQASFQILVWNFFPPPLPNFEIWGYAFVLWRSNLVFCLFCSEICGHCHNILTVLLHHHGLFLASIQIPIQCFQLVRHFSLNDTHSSPEVHFCVYQHTGCFCCVLLFFSQWDYWYCFCYVLVHFWFYDMLLGIATLFISCRMKYDIAPSSFPSFAFFIPRYNYWYICMNTCGRFCS